MPFNIPQRRMTHTCTHTCVRMCLSAFLFIGIKLLAWEATLSPLLVVILKVVGTSVDRLEVLCVNVLEGRRAALVGKDDLVRRHWVEEARDDLPKGREDPRRIDHEREAQALLRVVQRHRMPDE